MDYAKESVKLHKELKGKIDIVLKRHVNNRDLSLVYTPGVVAPCLAINKILMKYMIILEKAIPLLLLQMELPY